MAFTNQLLVKVLSAKKHYQDKNHTFEALKGISFDIYKGEILGLLEVNRTSQTTLSTILAGLHPCTFGDIQYKDRSIYEAIVSYRKMLLRHSL